MQTSSLSDKGLREAVLARSGGQCCLCESEDVTILDILDSRLWDRSDPSSDNAVALCKSHALEAWRTRISPEDLRRAAGIDRIHLPPQLYSLQRYDRWGNPILADGRRSRGEIFHEPEVAQSLREGGMLDLFVEWVKHPRTYLVSWSEVVSGDDRMIDSADGFKGRRVIATEKMDGENITLYRNSFHTRSLTRIDHPSRDWLEEYWREIAHQIPEGWRVCGENLTVTHSIHYDNLQSYFQGFAIWNEANVCIGWDDTLRFFESAGICPVPTLFDGEFDLDALGPAWRARAGAGSEGYVLRDAGAIEYRHYRRRVGKFIREGYRQSEPVRDNIRHGVPFAMNRMA